MTDLPKLIPSTDPLVYRFRLALWIRETCAPDYIMGKGARAAYHAALNGLPMDEQQIGALSRTVWRLMEAE